MNTQMRLLHSLCTWVLVCKDSLFSSQLPDQRVFNLAAARLPTTISVSVPSNGPNDQTQQHVPLKTGFVAFGDSYGAGIGTGYTSWDACRNGQNSYPLLLNATSDHFVYFESHTCTGDRTDNLLLPGGQIDSWFAPNLADFGTLSIGGDDLDFAVILDACVLRYQGVNSPVCNTHLQAAREQVAGELGPKMLEAAIRIIDQGGPGFHLWWTGYPRFFNAETKWCNNVTFWFWQPEHHENAPREGGDWAYLTMDRRRMLNDLVDELNILIGQVCHLVNRHFRETRATFVEMDPAFEGHRFCDVRTDGSEVQEPAASREETWFFLSGWPDSGDKSAKTSWHERQHRNSVSGHRLNLTRPLRGNETCLGRHEASRNNTEYVLCSIGAAVAELSKQTSTTRTKTLNIQDFELLEQIQAEGVEWWWPTNWIKTFHPRTLGYKAYKDEILRNWDLEI